MLVTKIDYPFDHTILGHLWLVPPQNQIRTYFNLSCGEAGLPSPHFDYSSLDAGTKLLHERHMEVAVIY